MDRRVKHERYGTPEYRIWADMKTRCNNPAGKDFHHYGGRGITVCKRWNESFAAFFSDMGERPSVKHSIDRINNDLPYEPSNCRWATFELQSLNKRNTNRLTLDGNTKTLKEWASELGMNYWTIRSRIKSGLSPAEILDPRHRPTGFQRRISNGSN